MPQGLQALVSSLRCKCPSDEGTPPICGDTFAFVLRCRLIRSFTVLRYITDMQNVIRQQGNTYTGLYYPPV